LFAAAYGIAQKGTSFPPKGDSATAAERKKKQYLVNGGKEKRRKVDAEEEEKRSELKPSETHKQTSPTRSLRRFSPITEERKGAAR